MFSSTSIRRLIALAAVMLLLSAAVPSVAAEGDETDSATVTETTTTTDDGAATDEGTTEDGTEDENVTEAPAFNNPTEVQRAENLATAAAEEPDPELEAKTQAAEDAETALNEAIEAELPEEQIAELQAAYEAAQQEADAAMASSTSVSTDDIADMRDAGMGWGEIAHELGVHPSALGMGQTKRSRTATETAMQGTDAAKNAKAKRNGFSTKRSLDKGYSQPPGAKSKGNTKSASVGLGTTKKESRSASSGNSGKGGGNGGGNSGNSGSNGNKGGNKGGNGKGGGNGGGNGGGKK